LAVPIRNVSSPGYTDDPQLKTDTRAMTVATALFFMVGFLTCLNDIVSPHLRSIFALDYAQTQSIPFFFFSSYFVFSYPAGKIVERFGYKKSMVVGLLVMALGALGFLPAAHLATFALFLTALVVLAAGMTVVQVAINPYVTVIGPAATASSRLNLAQAFNSVGTFIAPFIGTYLILRNTMAPATREQLLASVWTREHEITTRTVDIHVHRLRRKLGPAIAPCLVTVRRVGYLFRPLGRTGL